jgi:DNA polymerase
VAVASFDTETAASVELPALGVDAYAKHPDTRVWCMSYAIDDGPVKTWLRGDPDPEDLLEHVRRGGIMAAWNCYFDQTIWNEVLCRDRPHWPRLPTRQCRCTMAEAYALSLPGALDNAAVALNLPVRKDGEGYKLMRKMMRPTIKWRQARTKFLEGKGPDPGPPEWYDTPENIIRLGQYCDQDVVTERAAGKQIAKLSAYEQAVWQLDQTINRRGLLIDAKAASAAYEIAKSENRILGRELAEITFGAVKSGNNQPDMVAWLNQQADVYGFPVFEDLKKNKVQRRVAEGAPDGAVPLPAHVLRVLELRLQIAKSSTKKLKPMLEGRCPDGRVRGLFQYHGTTTGRWAARRIQPHNMIRSELKKREIDACFELFGETVHAVDVIRINYAAPLNAIASCMRGMLIPAPGCRFIGGDLAGIEGRVVAWLAGEEWKLDAFRDLDKGTGADNYKLAYSRSFGVPVEQVDDDQRQIGKVQELALGYQGSVGAFLSMGDNYGIVPSKIAKAVHAITDRYVWQDTAEQYPKEVAMQKGLSREVWTGLKVVVDAWRDAHARVKGCWYDTQDAAVRAIEDPRTVYETETGLIKWVSNREFLYCRLPSGRCLAYARPEVDYVPTKKGNRTKPQIRYMGLGKVSKKWGPQRTYGGRLVENATQAVARDVLVDAMFRLEAKGYPIVLHVHDEVVCEVPHDRGDPDELRDLICEKKPWVQGCPINAKPWTGPRYQK